MPTIATDIVNQALFLMGDREPAVTGNAPNFDNSVQGVAAKWLYAPCVAAVARTYEWDFARKVVNLSLSGNPAQLGFTFEYLYPTNGIEVWNVVDPDFDPMNPLPTNWTVNNALVSSVQTKVIWTDIADAIAVYNNNPTPDLWDAGFREAVVRRLAGEFARALAGRNETGESLEQSGMLAAQVAQMRDG